MLFMAATPEPSPEDDDLSTVLDRLERDVASVFRTEPDTVWGLLGLLLILILSPLVFFWMNHYEGKEWSETVKNVIESLALVAAAFGVCKWLDERRNRSTDVLWNLEKEFKRDKIMAGRNLVEDRDPIAADFTDEGRSDKLDCLLRFYVLLYGVLRARQVPEILLSTCFRYWLAHYFRSDRTRFRQYVDDGYPTISNWLKEDCARELRFFRPRRLFPGKVDEDFIQQCGGKKQCPGS